MGFGVNVRVRVGVRVRVRVMVTDRLPQQLAAADGDLVGGQAGERH